MLEAVLFDWGDTLAEVAWDEEVELAGTRAGLTALEREGLPEAEAVVRYFAERREELFVPGALEEVDFAALVRGCFVDLDSELSDEELDCYVETAFGLWHEKTAVDAQAHALLESLRARGLRLAIVSNTVAPGRLLEPVLERQGLLQRVDAAVFSSEVGRRKPDPAIFERALGELGVEPGRALMVGDRRYEDVRGGAEAGLRTVQALWFRADDHPDGRDPDFEAFTMMDVLNVVRRLLGER